ncbi:putative 4-hydroxybenzoate polyprenyl transferase [Daldinia caldariorum]|uniref:putative 4-hydroxybenzoate polyprenyl transferase n=1 Tax=Daldinia caldariorum TaxID=326644 RepID=UPI0020075540|nr:putative 4-hydroxybenzoate polyprenyl transferase [Daldinia caldariorum]KAI1466308.1 putative 4-hydroxybenzoate polyprenyl transferase [Daldinia caldariorum]
MAVTSSKTPLVPKKAEEKNPDPFADLPPYEDPKTGFLSWLPRAWIPYAQLMRIDRPAGLYAFYFPYLIGLAYAACIAPTAPNPLEVLKVAAIYLPMNILLRGAACSWNDTVDQEFDRQVERCRHRPVARGAVSTTAAHIFTASLVAAIYPILTFFPEGCKLHMGISVVLFFIYALMKRVTYYPQVFLGFPFAWAIFFCAATLGVDPFGAYALPTSALFAANVLWTIIYDTIYAHQDVKDDEKAGVKSMALRFRNNTKLLSTTLAVVMVALLALCGVWTGSGAPYYVGTVGGVAAAMTWYIYSVDLSSPQSCGAWFHDQFWIVGGALMAGFTAEYLCRVTDAAAARA